MVSAIIVTAGTGHDLKSAFLPFVMQLSQVYDWEKGQAVLLTYCDKELITFHKD